MGYGVSYKANQEEGSYGLRGCTDGAHVVKALHHASAHCIIGVTATEIRKLQG